MTNAETHTLSVPAMSCQHCIDAITGEVSPIVGVTQVDVDLDTKLVTVVGGDPADIIEAIDEAGFDATVA